MKRLTILSAVCMGLLALPLGANATTTPGGGLLGDVNLNGTIDILDIQATVNQVLEEADETAEADVTESGEVTILDVRQIINTVLGEGGLVQEVTGQVEFGASSKSENNDVPEARVIAISNEGLMKETEIDSETREFNLDLRGKTGWSVAVIVEAEEEGEADVVVGFLDFPVADTVSLTLPVPDLSVGERANLGVVDLSNNAKDSAPQAVPVAHDIRDIVGDMSKPLDVSDATGTGVPDVFEPILERAKEAPELPNNVEMGPFFDLVGPCIENWLQEEPPLQPSLTDRDGTGIPDFIQPLIECIDEVLEDWLDDRGVTPPGNSKQNGRPEFVDDILDHVEAGVPEWLDSLERPELVDSTGNGIPDFVEPHLSELGVPTVMDSEGNGVPDYAEDHTGNGVPNIVDEGAEIPGDLDRDGIPDDVDIDSNNSGIPDYADPDVNEQ